METKQPKSWIFRENSLDLIRLFAASEVAIEHTFEFMFADKTGTLFFHILKLFPGVPIFFFISGYLISRSYERSPNLREYSKNRILRLYPALIICVAVNLIMVSLTGYLAEKQASAADIGLLFIAKTTFLQFYNPDFMRQFGDGVLNGSLWTICVELQFYILTPIGYYLFGRNRAISNKVLFSLIIVFLIFNRGLYGHEDYRSEVWWKLLKVSFIPWIYMFLTGMLFQRNFEKISTYMAKLPFLALLAAYILAGLALNNAGFATSNSISPVLFILIALVIFRAAYFLPDKANLLLKGNDISYGIYIWHMPIVNQMLYLGYRHETYHAFIALGLSVLVAILSWKFVEKPSLMLKSITINSRLAKKNA